MNASKVVSPYYPPRARWFAPLLRLGLAIVRVLGLDRLYRPGAVSFGGLVASLLIPGVGFWLAGRRFLAKAAVAGYTLSLCVFVVALGRAPANIAFGLLISIHSTGLILLLDPWLLGIRFRTRLFCSLAVLSFLAGLLYLPARTFLDTHWLSPLQINDRVVIVHKLANPTHLRRGDWIAYSLPAIKYTQAGFGFGPILATAGDRVAFTPAAFEVNGITQPRRANMPESGEWVVPQKHWFLWPDFDISGHGNVNQQAMITQAIMESAMVAEEQLVGKPFKRWFWHTQFPS